MNLMLMIKTTSSKKETYVPVKLVCTLQFTEVTVCVPTTFSDSFVTFSVALWGNVLKCACTTAVLRELAEN